MFVLPPIIGSGAKHDKKGNTKELTIGQYLSLLKMSLMETDLKVTLIFHRKLKVALFQKSNDQILSLIHSEI